MEAEQVYVGEVAGYLWWDVILVDLVEYVLDVLSNLGSRFFNKVDEQVDRVRIDTGAFVSLGREDRFTDVSRESVELVLGCDGGERVTTVGDGLRVKLVHVLDVVGADGCD